MEQREQYLWVHLRTWRPSLVWRAEPFPGGITLQTGCVELMQLALSPDILNPHFKPQPLDFMTLPKACHRHNSFTGVSNMSQSYRAPRVRVSELSQAIGLNTSKAISVETKSTPYSPQSPGNTRHTHFLVHEPRRSCTARPGAD